MAAKPGTVRTETPRDIVSEYKFLVIPFLCVQVASWTLSFLQTAGVIGAAGWAASEAMTPIDIAFCQMMFWGTLHYGPLPDGRLSLVCRIAFIIEAVSFSTNCLTIYRPLSVEAAVEALNITSLVSRGERMLVGYIHTGVWLFIWGIFSAWVGTTALQVGRRKLLTNVDSERMPAFSTHFLRVYAAVLAFQLFVVGWSAVGAATAQTIEEQIFSNKVTYAARALSMCFAQLYGLKVVLLEASGTTVDQVMRGNASMFVYAALFFIAVYVSVLVVNLVLLAVATSSEDSVLVLPNAIEKFLLENFLYVPAWFLGMGNFGISLHHLVPWRSVDDTEMLLKQWKNEGYSDKELAFGLGGSKRGPRATVAPGPETMSA